MATVTELICKKLKNRNGMEVSLLNFGATITRITVPGKDGDHADLILGYEDVKDYLADTQLLGSTQGRYANRISQSQFTINGKNYKLTPNEGANQLHGGWPSFGQKYWETAIGSDNISFTYISPDGENGYPGTLTTNTIYYLNDENELTIGYHAQSDKDTVINLTNHAYFNLNSAETIKDHLLQVNADSYIVTNEENCPTGEIRSVAGTPMDMRSPVRLGDIIDSDYKTIKRYSGLDSCFAVNGSDLRVAAILTDPVSGRTLEIETDMPGIQVYTSQLLPTGIKGLNGQIYGPYSAVCLEAQNYPDAPNHPHFPSAVLKAGDSYTATIICRFKF